MQTILRFENITSLADVSHGRVFHKRGVLVVGTVVGYGASCSLPWTTYVLWFSKVGQCQYVASVGGSTCLVGYPHLYAFDRHTAGYGGQCAHVLVVGVTEVVCQIEVTVFLIVRNLYFVGGGI